LPFLPERVFFSRGPLCVVAIGISAVSPGCVRPPLTSRSARHITQRLRSSVQAEQSNTARYQII
jgi:hypothetical protein